MQVQFQSIAIVICLRNRKRVACVNGVIMHAGNVRRIREKRVKTRRSLVVASQLRSQSIAIVICLRITALLECIIGIYKHEFTNKKQEI